MDAGSSGLNWPQVIGSAALPCVVLGIVYWFVWYREQAKEKRRERPPQEEKILRRAGYFALCRIEDLNGRLMFALMEALGAGAVFGGTVGSLWPAAAGLALGRFTFAQLYDARRSDVFLVGVLFALVALLFAIHGLQGVWKLMAELRNRRFGLRGEQAVAEKLATGQLAAAGYVVFHDIPAERAGKNFNLDHVVVGPGGVFVLETKARPRRKPKWQQKEGVAIFDGVEIRFPWCYDRKAVSQVNGNVAWLRDLLEGYAPKDLLIHPVIVVPGWKVEPTGNHLVKVMDADYLVDRYLIPFRRTYGPEQLRAVVSRLDEACRTLEF